MHELREPKSKREYRVPVEHRAFGETGPELEAQLGVLPRGNPSFDQLRAILSETGGVGLFAPAAIVPADDEEDTDLIQAALGAVIVLPPSDWPVALDEFKDWQYDGLDATFDGLGYGPDDIVVFARLNFSPDCWLLGTRGPKAGKVFWWTHDGDSQMDTPWAEDIAGWGRRVRDGIPEVFGGAIRFWAAASPDGPPEDAELYPERLETGSE